MQNLPYGQLVRGDAPVLVVTPHTGVAMPQTLRGNDAWLSVEGCQADPFGALLKQAAEQRGITSISARDHPCVIDFNVALDNRPLSTRLNRVGLCRTHTSRGDALYAAGCEPSEAEVGARVEQFWKPFHAALAREIARLRERHDHVLVLVSHASSWLSPYREQSGAAECNIGSNRGDACDRRFVAAITGAAQAANRSWVVNGKLADAYIAQHYGMPAAGVHALEIEAAGRWRLDCEQLAIASAGAAADDAVVKLALDALDAAARAMPGTESTAQAGSERNGRI